jgi:hypothetical protein
MNINQVSRRKFPSGPPTEIDGTVRADSGKAEEAGRKPGLPWVNRTRLS